MHDPALLARSDNDNAQRPPDRVGESAFVSGFGRRLLLDSAGLSKADFTSVLRDASSGPDRLAPGEDAADALREAPRQQANRSGPSNGPGADGGEDPSRQERRASDESAPTSAHNGKGEAGQQDPTATAASRLAEVAALLLSGDRAASPGSFEGRIRIAKDAKQSDARTGATDPGASPGPIVRRASAQPVGVPRQTHPALAADANPRAGQIGSDAPTNSVNPSQPGEREASIERPRATGADADDVAQSASRVDLTRSARSQAAIASVTPIGLQFAPARRSGGAEAGPQTPLDAMDVVPSTSRANVEPVSASGAATTGGHEGDTGSQQHAQRGPGAGVEAHRATQLERAGVAERTNDAQEAALRAQVQRGFAAMLRRGGEGEMTLQLHPASLGALRVSMKFGAGGVRAELSASTGEARRLLERSLTSLRDSMESRGVRIDEIVVGEESPAKPDATVEAVTPLAARGTESPVHRDSAERTSRRMHGIGGADHDSAANPAETEAPANDPRALVARLSIDATA